MTPQEALQKIIAHRELEQEEMLSLMHAIMRGEVSPVWIAALISALRVKRESVGEITAAARVMRELATRVPVSDATQLVDTCGTGGDGAHTFNISTAAMFVAAAAGAKVAKHGGRSVSSSSGSADVLEALGVNLALSPSEVAQCIDNIGIGFMFAPNHHSAMKHASPVRRELGVRTIFNLLGPLTNPAGAANQVMGVFDADLVGIQVRVLQQLGSRNALVVHGRDGLDELSIAGETFVGELRGNQIREYVLTPDEVGLSIHSLADLQVADVQASKAMLVAALSGQHSAARDIVAYNAGASLYVAELTSTLHEGVSHALNAIENGEAMRKLDAFVAYTQSFASAQ